MIFSLLPFLVHHSYIPAYVRTKSAGERRRGGGIRLRRCPVTLFLDRGIPNIPLHLLPMPSHYYFFFPRMSGRVDEVSDERSPCGSWERELRSEPPNKMDSATHLSSLWYHYMSFFLLVCFICFYCCKDFESESRVARQERKVQRSEMLLYRSRRQPLLCRMAAPWRALASPSRPPVEGRRLEYPCPRADITLAPTPSRSPRTVEVAERSRESRGTVVTREDEEVFTRTLHRPLVRRHTRSPRSEGHQRVDGSISSRKPQYDPALVLHVDSSTKEVHLNPVQKALVWRARRRVYQTCLMSVVHCLQSHLSPLEKCLLLLQLHQRQVIPQRLRLRPDTYEDIFHLCYATATLSAAPTVEEEEALNAQGEQSAHLVRTLPPELASRSAAVLTLTSPETVHKVWEMYRYMVDSGTNPTSRIVQHMMGLLERRARVLGLGEVQKSFEDPHSPPHTTNGTGLAQLEAMAHSLMLDVDRFHLIPSMYTVHSYIFLCQVCGVMHLAMARVTDYFTRFEQQPSGDTYAMLLHGFLHQPKPPAGVPDNRVADALAVLTTLQSTPITQPLLHEMLQVGRYSPDPLSAFTMYQGVMCRVTRDGELRPSAAVGAGRIAPTLATFSILVEALLRAHHLALERHPEAPFPEAQLDFVLLEMRRHRIRGNKAVLNKVLECFRQCGRHRDLVSLRESMLARGISVFDEYRRL
eukprot:gene9670-6767_t